MEVHKSECQSKWTICRFQSCLLDLVQLDLFTFSFLFCCWHIGSGAKSVVPQTKNPMREKIDRP